MKPVNEAIDRIEQCRPNFDYDEVHEYARLVRSFFAGMKAHFIETRRPLETPLADSVLDESIHLPAAIVERLESVISKHRDYSRTVRRVCYWYLREAYAAELGTIERSESLYEPLIQVLDKGGHFYEENGLVAQFVKFLRRTRV